MCLQSAATNVRKKIHTKVDHKKINEDPLYFNDEGRVASSPVPIEDIFAIYGKKSKAKIHCGANKCCIETTKNYCLLIIKQHNPRHKNINLQEEYQNLKSLHDRGLDTTLIIDEKGNSKYSKPVLVKATKLNQLKELGINNSKSIRDEDGNTRDLAINVDNNEYYFEIFPTRLIKNGLVLHNNFFRTDHAMARKIIFQVAYDFKKDEWKYEVVDNLMSSLEKNAKFLEDYYIKDLQFMISEEGKLFFMDVEEEPLQRQSKGDSYIRKMGDLLKDTVYNLPSRGGFNMKTYNEWLTYVQDSYKNLNAKWYYQKITFYGCGSSTRTARVPFTGFAPHNKDEKVKLDHFIRDEKVIDIKRPKNNDHWFQLKTVAGDCKCANVQDENGHGGGDCLSVEDNQKWCYVKPGVCNDFEHSNFYRHSYEMIEGRDDWEKSIDACSGKKQKPKQKTYLIHLGEPDY